MSIKAKEVLKNKFWIVESQGEKVGTISYNDEKFILSTGQSNTFHENHRSIQKTLGAKVDWQALEITEIQPEKVIHGYDTSCIPFNEIFDVKRKLPLFTKSAKSKSLYCAGYYIIKFDKGWVKSFCPKLITIERYDYKGPFKTELEMRQELSRANQK